MPFFAYFGCLQWGRGLEDLPRAAQGLHQGGDPNQTKRGQKAVLEARDGRLIDAARLLEPQLRPAVANSGTLELQAEQPKALDLTVVQGCAFATPQRLHRDE